MSGGKETPRQKMIGMMYLFYTALLALQIDTAVLEKFILIDQTLEIQVEENTANNNSQLMKIESQVAEKGNREDDMKVLTTAQEVRAETNKVLTEMQTMRTTMADITGGYDEDGRLVGAKDQDQVATMMIQQGGGKKLEALLNNYAGFLGDKTGKPEDYPKIAQPAKEIDQFKNDKNQNTKNFSELYFESTPTGAGMASMSQLMTEVLAYEARAMKYLGEQVGVKDISFDQIFPLVRPESKVVAIGGKYNAQMFIAASSSAFEPEMAMGGRELPIEEMEVGPYKIKYGKIEFTATGGGTPVPGTSNRFRKTFQAEIKLSDSTYTENIEYEVVRPVMQISSKALSALWKNCGNELSVKVPELGNAYNPTISADNATVVKGAGPGDVTIIPTGSRAVVLKVVNEGTQIGTQTFRVKDIPPPSYNFKLGRSNIDMERGIEAKAFRGGLEIQAVAERNFKDDVPKDARYRTSEVEVIVKRGADAAFRRSFKTDKINLNQVRGQVQPRKGDFLVIKIARTTRTNFQNKRENVSVRGEIYTIPIN